MFKSQAALNLYSKPPKGMRWPPLCRVSSLYLRAGLSRPGTSACPPSWTSCSTIADFGCLDSLSKLITIYEHPNASFTYDPFTISTLQAEMSFTNTSLNALPILWNFDDTTFSTLEHPIHIFEDPGTYDVWLTVTDSNQCLDSIKHTIIMYYDFILYVPNSFTPDKNGMNEQFGPKGVRMEKYHSYEFTIFNRWGEKVFTTDEVREKWNGINAQAGTYSWIIIITDELGGVHKKVGEVLLIR